MANHCRTKRYTKIIYIILFLLVNHTLLLAANSGKIVGTVKDAGTGEALIGVTARNCFRC